MSNITDTSSSSEEDYDISDTEWIVIVVVLVIVLLVLIITVAKCLEIGKPPSDKSLLQDDFQSVRSGNGTVRSVASSKSKSKSLKKMPLNAEITRFSAGRASRSAQYGVVIKDIGKSVQTEGIPPHYQHSNTAPPAQPQQSTEPRYVSGSQLHAPQANGTLSSPPSAAMIVDREYATTGRPKRNTQAVFVAPEEGPYYNAVAPKPVLQSLPTQAAVPLQMVNMGGTYQVISPRPQVQQPVILMQ